MKILRYFFYILLGLFVLFIIAGVVKPTVSYQSEVTIDASVNKCWQVFVDSSRLDEWVINFHSIEPLGKSVNGKEQFKLIVMDNGEEYALIETVVQYTEHEKYVFDLENEVLVNRVEYTFDDLNGNARIIASENLQGKGFLMKSIFVFMKGMFHSTQQQSLNALKQSIEQEQDGY